MKEIAVLVLSVGEIIVQTFVKSAKIDAGWECLEARSPCMYFLVA